MGRSRTYRSADEVLRRPSRPDPAARWTVAGRGDTLRGVSGDPATNEPDPRVWPFVALVAAGMVVAITIALYGLVDQLPRFSDPVERNGVRTATLAAIAGVGAFVTLILSARAHLLAARAHVQEKREAVAVQDRHERDLADARERQTQQLAAERARADRLHLTQLFDSAADKLGAHDDATRTAAVLILERLYNDARTLLVGDDQASEQRDALQRSITETLCGYVRERSAADSRAWHADRTRGHDLAAGLHSGYRSPPSIRATVNVLGRLPNLPASIERFDLTGSHLSQAPFSGHYRTTLDLNGATFGGDLVFRGVIDGAAIFRDVAISGDARFTAGTVTGSIVFDGAVIGGTANFRRAAISANVWFRSATVDGDVWLRDATVGGDVLFNNTAIHGTARFGAASVDGTVSFHHTTIRGGARFRGAAIGGNTWFRYAEVHGAATFAEATLGGDASFREATIVGDVSFQGARFSGGASFRRATFGKDALFDGVKLNRAARFGEVAITGNASFREAQIAADVSFRDATVGGAAVFDGATFDGTAGFGGMCVRGDASFRGTIFNRSASLRSATVGGVVSFRGGVLAGDITFSGVTLGRRRRRTVLDLGANWGQRVFGLQSLRIAGASAEVDLDGASFSFADDDPRRWP